MYGVKRSVHVHCVVLLSQVLSVHFLNSTLSQLTNFLDDQMKLLSLDQVDSMFLKKTSKTVIELFVKHFLKCSITSK